MIEEAILSEEGLEDFYRTPEGKKVLTCIQCGLCAGTCPYGDVMEYTPRKLIAMIRADLIDEVVDSESIMKCVACYSCTTKCPRGIQLTEVLLSIIKGKTMGSMTELPAELQKSLEDTLRYGNSLGMSPRKRADWTADLEVPIRILSKERGPVDVLWNVGCYGSYYSRNIDVSLATARLLQLLEVDFAILGEEERDLGETGSYFGEVGLQEELIEANIPIFQKYEFNEMVISSVHGYHAFKVSYPEAGYNPRSEHITVYMNKNLSKLEPLLKKPFEHKVAYHDSCYLGKANGIFDEPRELLEAVPGVELVEMAHNRENSLCCGGGGGGMWLDTYFKEKDMERLSERRVKEAVASGADVLAVSCDYEISRFEDAIKVLGYDDKLIVRDVMEILDASVRDGDTE